MKRSLAATLVFGLALSGAAHGQDAPAAQDAGTPYVQAFCSLGGVDGGMGRLYLVSPDLKQAVTAALAENAARQAANPGEKPPLGDGVPWQSSPDAAPNCEAGATTIDGDRLVAEVKYSFPDDADAGWVDRLVLVKGADGAYVVDDVLYGAQGEESLRAVLSGAFTD